MQGEGQVRTSKEIEQRPKGNSPSVKSTSQDTKKKQGSGEHSHSVVHTKGQVRTLAQKLLGARSTHRLSVNHGGRDKCESAVRKERGICRFSEGNKQAWMG
jgi:hypothetical protein